MNNGNRIFLLTISMFVGACLVVLMSGCQAARTVADRIEGSPVASLAIEYAAAKYVGGDVDRGGV